jgi:hypothetical protein
MGYGEKSPVKPPAFMLVVVIVVVFVIVLVLGLSVHAVIEPRL